MLFELAAMRVPDLNLAGATANVVTVSTVAERWKASRVDVAQGTMATYHVALGRVLPRFGTTAADKLDAQAIADMVADLHAAGLKKQTIRKTVSVLAMVLDHARVEPNPARDRLTVKMPREQKRQVQPPTADHVEAVIRLLPSRYRLPTAVLDATGMRVGELEALMALVHLARICTFSGVSSIASQQNTQTGGEMKSRLLPLVVAAAFALVVGIVAAIAAPGPLPPPTGERTHAQSQLEPVFNAENSGEVGYINTPDGTKHPVPSNPASWSPIYLPVYPTSSTITTTGSGATGPLSCMHFEGSPGTDNCPDHGNGIAGLAKSCPATIPVLPGSDSCSQAVRNVYAGGVAGHDHVMDFPGGADWNVAWEPIIVLFTNANAANTRLLTDAQIDAAIASHNAIAIPRPGRTFHCSLVSDSVWALSTAVLPG